MFSAILLEKRVGKTLLLATLIITINIGCRRGGRDVRSELTPEQYEQFHADNDIAMTVLSLADAIKVGEPLDSVDYDFRGVLTDGQGTPLYTDIEGNPGNWDIDVLDKGKVLIRNLCPGDLLPVDLESYILESLKLTRENRLPSLADTIDDTGNRAIYIYALSGGYLRYEVEKITAGNGLEGSMVTITLGVSPLPEDEIQKAA